MRLLANVGEYIGTFCGFLHGQHKIGAKLSKDCTLLYCFQLPTGVLVHQTIVPRYQVNLTESNNKPYREHVMC